MIVGFQLFILLFSRDFAKQSAFHAMFTSKLITTMHSVGARIAYRRQHGHADTEYRFSVRDSNCLLRSETFAYVHDICCICSSVFKATDLVFPSNVDLCATHLKVSFIMKVR